MKATAVGNIGNGNLSDLGNGVYRTEHYEITVTRDEVLVKDLRDGKTVRVWGDPHVETSDGDKAEFQSGNLTLDLDDGTKLTIVPTAKCTDGKAFVDKVVITNGFSGAEIDDVHGAAGPRFGTVGTNGKLLDDGAEDGSVLHCGADVASLYFLDDKGQRVEIVGTDSKNGNKEYDVANKGGTAAALSVVKAAAGSHEYEFQQMFENDARIAQIEQMLRDGKNPDLDPKVFGTTIDKDSLATTKMEWQQRITELRQQNMLMYQQLTEEARGLYEALKQAIQNMRA